MTHPLEGWGILITRPPARAGSLAERVTGAGGRAVFLPAVRIEALPVPELAPLADLEPGDWVIWISPAAVEHSTPWLARVPAGAGRAAVGPATAAALRAAGMRRVLAPREGGSEALLARLADHDLRGRRVLIVRGQGGRELLAESLAARGAQVHYLETYRRRCPQAAPPAALEALDRGSVQAVTATSAEILENLLTLVGAERSPMLRGLPLVVVSPRLAERARSLGFRGPVLCAGPDDEQIMNSLLSLSAWPAP